MPDRTRNRSGGYQFNLIEVAVSPFILGDLSAAQGMAYRFQPFEESEMLLDLKEELKVHLWRIIETGLTKRQREVVKLSMDGYTQNEIAKQLGINQTSVHKVLRGNIDYRMQRRRYGGAFKKILKLAQADIEIQKILTEIKDLYECLEL